MTVPAEGRSPVPPLARSAVDRAEHRRTDHTWLADSWPTARVLVVDTVDGGRAPVIDRDSGLALLLLPSAQSPPVDPAGRLFLGVDVDGTALFAVDARLDPVLSKVPGARPGLLRQIGHLLDDRDTGLLTTALSLANWHAGHRFSPVTGEPTTAVEGGWTRTAPSGRQFWPRTDPAIITLVHDGMSGAAGRCLLGHNSAWGGGRVRRFSCLAGFVEAGESAEAAVVREVAEEVGVTVERVTYVASQAWPMPGSLMLGFTAYAAPGQRIQVDGTEIAQARWCDRNELSAVYAGREVDLGDGAVLGLPPAASIAAYLIERWLYQT